MHVFKSPSNFRGQRRVLITAEVGGKADMKIISWPVYCVSTAPELENFWHAMHVNILKWQSFLYRIVLYKYISFIVNPIMDVWFDCFLAKKSLFTFYKYHLPCLIFKCNTVFGIYRLRAFLWSSHFWSKTIAKLFNYHLNMCNFLEISAVGTFSPYHLVPILSKSLTIVRKWETVFWVE